MTANQYADMAEKTTRRPLTEQEIQAHKNLRKIWLAKKKDLRLTQESAGDSMGYTQGAVSHYLNGIIPLNSNAIFKFAQLLDVDPTEISVDLLPWRIGSGYGPLAKARQKVSEPPPAGMEPAQMNDDGVNRQNRLQIRSVPVLSSKEILQGIRQESENRQYIPAQQVSNEAFAFPVGSIPNPNDRYGIDADMYIVVDPEAEWENGKPLLLKDINNNLLIRRYEVVGSKRYLAPFNDKYDPMELDTSFTVIGKIVSRHAMY